MRCLVIAWGVKRNLAFTTHSEWKLPSNSENEKVLYSQKSKLLPHDTPVGRIWYPVGRWINRRLHVIFPGWLDKERRPIGLYQRRFQWIDVVQLSLTPDLRRKCQSQLWEISATIQLKPYLWDLQIIDKSAWPAWNRIFRRGLDFTLAKYPESSVQSGMDTGKLSPRSTSRLIHLDHLRYSIDLFRHLHMKEVRS